MLEGKFLWVQGRKKVSFRVRRGRLVYLGSARFLYGVSRSEFREVLQRYWFYKSKFVTVQAL